jgi:hypothetical protein
VFVTAARIVARAPSRPDIFSDQQALLAVLEHLQHPVL